MNIAIVPSPDSKGRFPIIQIDSATGKERPIATAGSWADALKGLAEIADKWAASKTSSSQPHKKRSALKMSDTTYVLIYSDGKPQSVIMAEPASITGSHPGDILVDKPGVK